MARCCCCCCCSSSSTSNISLAWCTGETGLLPNLHGGGRAFCDTLLATNLLFSARTLRPFDRWSRITRAPSLAIFFRLVHRLLDIILFTSAIYVSVLGTLALCHSRGFSRSFCLWHAPLFPGSSYLKIRASVVKRVRKSRTKLFLLSLLWARWQI